MVKEIKDVVTWLKQWFYDTTQVDGLLANKVNKNQGNANYNVVTDASGYVTVEPKAHAGTITDGTAHPNIGTSANATQSSINTAIDTAIGTLKNIKALEIVSSLPTASANTMNRLYIVNENSKVNVYYTKQTGTGSSATYSWVKMDDNILDELTVNWNDVQYKPFSTVDTTITDGSENPVTNNAIFDALTLKQNQIEVVTTLPDLANVSNGYMVIYRDTSKNPYEHNLYYANKLGSASSSWGWVIYKDFISIATLINSKVSKGDAVTSISLVPKGTDPTADAYNGVIRLYYGDEP